MEYEAVESPDIWQESVIWHCDAAIFREIK